MWRTFPLWWSLGGCSSGAVLDGTTPTDTGTPGPDATDTSDADADADADSDADTDADTDSDADTDTGDSGWTRPRCEDPGPDAPVTRIAPVQSMTFQGFPVVYHVPADPVAVVFYFHGTDDLVGEILGTEQVATLWNLLGSEGVALVATSRSGEAWDRTAGADLARLDALRRELVAATALEDTTPVVASGFADGAGMALAFPALAAPLGWPVVAVTAHDGSAGVVPTVPTQLHLATHEDPQAIEDLDDFVAGLETTGLVHEQLLVPERTVSPDVFLRLEGWGEPEAQAAFDDLVAHGLIDATGARRVPDGELEPAIAAWQESSALPGVDAAAERLRVVWSMARYSAFEAGRECAFVLDQLPG